MLIMQKWKKIITSFILIAFTITLFQPSNVSASTTEAANGFSKYTAATISELTNFPIFHVTHNYNIEVDRTRVGTGKLFNAATGWGPGWKAGSNLSGFTYIHNNNVNDWANKLNGNPNYVNSNANSTSIRPGQKMWTSSNMNYENSAVKTKSDLNLGAGVTHRHIRLLTETSGANITSFTPGESGKISIETTAYPAANISGKSTSKTGETVTLKVSGSSYVTNSSNNKGVKLELYEGNKLIRTENKTSTNTANISVPINKSTAGKYTYKLVVTDGVQRKTETTYVVEFYSGSAPPSGGGGTVQLPPSPPPTPDPPPAPPTAPDVQVYAPAKVKTGEPFNVEYMVWSMGGKVVNLEVSENWGDCGAYPTGEGSDDGLPNAAFAGEKQWIATKPGTCWFRVEATDENGQTGWNGALITVEYIPPPPKPPETNIYCTSFVNEGTEFDVKAISQAFEGRSIKTWEWTLPSGFQAVSGGFNNDSGGVLRAPTGSGNWKSYDIKLKVTDTGGHTAEAVSKVRVGKGPEVTISAPEFVGRGQLFSITDDIKLYGGATLVEKVWTISNDFEKSNFGIGNNGGNLKAKETAGGNYRLNLKVTDSNGGEAEAETFVYVLMGPSAMMQYRSPIIEGQPFTVKNLSFPNDPGSTITSVTWDISSIFEVVGGFIDGKEEYTLKAPLDTYPATKYPNTYPVKLTATDSNGRTNTITSQIEVILRPENQAPEAIFSMPAETYRYIPVKLVEQSMDTDGGLIAKWEWVLPESVDEVEPFDSQDRDENGRATYTVKFNELGTHQIKLIVTDDGTETNFTRGVVKTNELIKTVTVKNMEPVANFAWMDNPMQGQDVEIINYSIDHDGEIAKAEWIFDRSEDVEIVEPLGLDGGTVYFDKPGDYNLKLIVTDNDGATAEVEKGVTVAPAIPIAHIYDDPYFKKQNRKIDFYGELVDELTGLNKASWTPERYPIIWDEAQWTFEALSGKATNEAIKIRSSSDLSKREILFRQPGEYKATLKVKNTAGYWSEPYETTFMVEPDEPPVADFFVPTAYVREVDEDNPTELAKATINLIDASYSIDGDDIVQRIWKYKYDSNNDGSFADEPWEILNDANETEPSLTVTDVGRYYFELEVVEGFDSPTLPEFISPEDYLRANTDNKLMIEKVVEVVNIAPTVSWDYKKKEKVDVVFALGDVSAETKTSLENNMALLQAQLEEAGFDAKVTFNETLQVDSNSQEAKVIFNEWKDFPTGSAGQQWLFDEDLGEVYSPTNPGFETGFYDPLGFDIKDFSMEAKVYSNQPNQPIGLVFKLHQSPSYPDRYNMYYWWASGTHAVLYKVENIKLDSPRPSNSGTYSATPLVSYTKTSDYKRNYELYRDADNTTGSFFGNYGGQLGGGKADGGYKTTRYEGGQIVDYYVNAKNRYIDLGRNIPKNEISSVVIAFSQDTIEQVTLYASENGTNWTPFKNTHTTAQHTLNPSEIPGDTIRYIRAHSTVRVDHICVSVNYNSSTFLGWPYYPPYDYGGFPHDTLLKRGVQVTNVVDPLLKTTILNYVPVNHTRDWHKISANMQGNTITTSFDNNSIVTTDIDAFSKGTMGFFQYSHVGPRFRDIVITSQSMKTLDEVVKSHTWGTGSTKFIADVHDGSYQPEYLDKPPRISVLFGDLLSREIDLSIFGNASNKDTAEQMIALNDNEGTFIYNNDDMSGPLYEYGNYIINKVRSKQDKQDYLIVNEDEIIIEPAYGDTENDPWIAERWKYIHEPDHFENPMGLANYHDVFIPEPVIIFDKTGEFNVDMQRRDNPKNDIRFDNYRQWSQPIVDEPYKLYVHRKPVPQFTFKLEDIANSNNQRVIITENSFDLDNESKPERGIVKKEWYWKEATSTTWIAGKPTQIERTKSYLVKLVVEDYEGVVVQDVKAITDSGMPPVAKFVVDPNPAIAKKPFTIIDLSYDPNGDDIVEHQWKVRNPSNVWQDMGNVKPSQFDVLGLHVIELRIKDETGLWSEPFTQDVMVNNLAPVAQFTMNPNPAATGETVTFTDTSYDPNGDNIVERKWTLTDPLGDETEYVNSMPPTSYTQVGDWIVTLEVKDEHDLWSTPTSRILTILNTPPNAQFTMLPNPAKIGELVTITNLSWDTDGHTMSFDWDITREGHGLVDMFSDGVRSTPYSFTKSFDIEGKYFVRLVATDEFGATGEAVHSLIVWTPLEITGSGLDPNPAQAGIRVTATIETDGYAESVKLTFNDPKLGLQVVNLEPSTVLPSKTNTWTGKFRTSPWIPDGVYPVQIEARRSGVTGISGPQQDSVTEYLHIEGTVYDDTRTTIRN